MKKRREAVFITPSDTLFFMSSFFFFVCLSEDVLFCVFLSVSLQSRQISTFYWKTGKQQLFFLRSSILKSSTSHIHKQCVREEALRTTSAGQQELNPVLCLNELLPRSEHRGKSSVFRQLYTLELTICSVFPFCIKIIRISTCLDCIIHHSEKLKKNKISALTLK